MIAFKATVITAGIFGILVGWSLAIALLPKPYNGLIFAIPIIAIPVGYFIWLIWTVVYESIEANMRKHNRI